MTEPPSWPDEFTASEWKKLPRWARNRIEGMSEDLDDVRESLEAAEDRLRAEDTFAELWGDIAIRRARDGDGLGYLRACRAARLLREGITCATGRP